MADAILATLSKGAASAVVEADGTTMTVPLTARRFGTGSAGYHWQGKVEGQNGRRYQAQVQLVLIGSKDA